MMRADSRLVTAFVAVGASGALLTAVGAAVYGHVVAASVGLGALTALANLLVLSRIVAAVAVPYQDAATNAGFAWGVIALGKILALFGGLWLLLSRHLVDPLPLVAGYGSLPIGIAIGAVVSDKIGPRPST
jgi:hypothetical protein